MFGVPADRVAIGPGLPIQLVFGNTLPHLPRVGRPGREMRKPFEVLADGLISENSRDDRTPLELRRFNATAWPGHLVRTVDLIQ